MKPILFLLFLSLIISLPLQAQLNDDFNDGNFTDQPEWIGETQKFEVVNGQLRLNDPDAGSRNTAYLSLLAATSTNDLTTWEFTVNLDFAPSSGNNAKVYLNASVPDLSGSLQGYYLLMGGISGNQDAIELHRQDGTQNVLLASGIAGNVGSDPVAVSVRVTRDQEGNWTISTDYQLGSNFSEEFSVQDSTYKLGQYFGFLCSYSSTRASNFGFDDVLIDPLFVDRIPPSLLAAEAISSTELLLTFDEPLDSMSTTSLTNYSISLDIGQPVGANWDVTRPNEVILSLGQNLISTQTYQITVVNLEDISNNAMPAQSADFTYFDIQAAVSGDLIITEIQADPTPSQGLPEFEYMELYNASDKVLQLSELSISTGSSPEPIPDFLLLPNQYVLLVDDSGASAFNIDNVVGLNRFPTLADREDEINITNTNEESILSLIYFDDWYPDGDFNDGGFALELIDLTKAQDCPSNWSNSIDSNGGTPGLANSLLGSDTEQDAPQLIEFEIVSASELQLIFNEQLDLSTALNFSTYDFSPALDIMDIVESEEPNGFSIILNTPIQAALAYELTIGTALSDCIGNTLAVPIIQRFGLPEAPAANDIVINELLSFPISGGSDFVELYNRSAKIINLKGIDLLNTFKISGDTLQTIEVNYLLFPQEFVVLTEVPEDITSLYEVRFPEKILDTNLPTLDNNEGNITLRFGGLIIDAFDYNDDLRFSLLDNTRGISLERISTEQPTNASGNWHSAAESVGFATPTYENSQLVSLTPVSDIVTIENPRFSPDGDGFEDVLLIQVNPGVSGYVANAKVFDSYGRLVKDLVNNRLLASEDLLKWDGRNNEETMARLGAYVLWIELFDLEGNKQIMKETIVVAGRLD